MRHDVRMDRDWKRLGRAIRAARETLGMTQVDLVAAAGVARQTLLSLEKGQERSRMPSALPKIEQALNWPPRTAARILVGGDPPPLLPDEPSPEPDNKKAPFAEDMPLRAQQELSEGQVVDTEVLDLTRPGSGHRVVVVFKRDAEAADMDPAELRDALEEWSRVQRALRGLTSLSTDE